MSGSNVFDNENVIHGGDVYRNKVVLDYSVNLNPMPLPEAVETAAREGLAGMHQYPDPLHQKLREAIAGYEDVDAANVLCGSGASELILAACHAFRPRRALVTAPCYAGYSYALDAVDAEVTEYTLDESKGFALDEGFLDCITSGTDMVFIADPNNPDGRLTDRDLKQRIAGRCKSKGVVLVIDECFLPLTGRGLDDHGTCGSALHLRAFTKTFAIPGIRAGYMISADTARLEAVQRHLPEWNMSCIAERVGEAAAGVLRDTDYLENSLELIDKERKFLAGEIAGLGIKVYDSDTNFLLIRSDSGLYDRLLERGILIRRCANFSGLDDTYYRLAVRDHEDNIRLVGALCECLR